MYTSKVFLVLSVLGVIHFHYPAHATQPHRKVLILGGGVSGIVAGKTLKDNGIDDFLVLEGQDYIGGRVRQGEMAGYRIEKGANWIHFAEDEETAPMWAQKVKKNIRGFWSNYSNLIIRDKNGNDVSDMGAYHRLLKVFEHVEEVQEQRTKANMTPIPARTGLSLMGWNPKTPAEYALEYLEIDFENSKQAELVPFTGIFEKGKDFFLADPRGTIALFSDLYKDFEDKFQLSKTVAAIDYTSSTVKVTTSDGEVYTADHVLCTFSTGVLASEMVTFSPPLPVWKREAILTMPMSVYTKIFLKFPKKFWDDKEYILYAGPTRETFPVFQDLQRPGIYPNNSGLLLITVTGDEGRRIEKQSFEDTKAEIVKTLRGVYGPDVPEPTDIFYPRWSLNKYIRGSYSEGTVGVTSKTFENLLKNLGNVYFAGEALSEDWYGYLQGAYITGEEQAKRIAKVVKCQENGQVCAPAA